MSNYRRSFTMGGCYFLTLVTYKRQSIFSIDKNINRFRDAIRHVQQKHPFVIDAISILPDHIHMVINLPDGESDFSSRIRLIKHYVSVGITTGKNYRQEKQVWQRRFWEHEIRNTEDWRKHVDYVHYNPVKHGYVSKPSDWSYGSFIKVLKDGWYEEDWGSSEPDNIAGMKFE